MIKTITDFYEMELRDRKGECIRLQDFEVDFTVALIGDAKTIVAHQLVVDGKAKLYYGVHMNANAIPQIVEEIGEMKLFNEVKEKKDAVLNMNDFVQQYAREKGLGKNEDLVMDDEFHEKFNEAAHKALEKHKEDVEAAIKTTTIKVYNDEYMLLPHDVEMGEYQRVINKINEHGQSIYGEYVFIEIL